MKNVGQIIIEREREKDRNQKCKNKDINNKYKI